MGDVNIAFAFDPRLAGGVDVHDPVPRLVQDGVPPVPMIVCIVTAGLMGSISRQFKIGLVGSSMSTLVGGDFQRNGAKRSRLLRITWRYHPDFLAEMHQFRVCSTDDPFGNARSTEWVRDKNCPPHAGDRTEEEVTLQHRAALRAWPAPRRSVARPRNQRISSDEVICSLAISPPMLWPMSTIDWSARIGPPGIVLADDGRQIGRRRRSGYEQPSAGRIAEEPELKPAIDLRPRLQFIHRVHPCQRRRGQTVNEHHGNFSRLAGLEHQQFWANPAVIRIQKAQIIIGRNLFEGREGRAEIARSGSWQSSHSTVS